MFQTLRKEAPEGLGETPRQTGDRWDLSVVECHLCGVALRHEADASWTLLAPESFAQGPGGPTHPAAPTGPR